MCLRAVVGKFRIDFGVVGTMPHTMCAWSVLVDGTPALGDQQPQPARHFRGGFEPRVSVAANARRR